MADTLNLRRAALLLTLMICLPGIVSAGGFSDQFAGKVTGDGQAQEQIKNAVDALEAAVEGAVTKGNITRGASGPLMQLVYSSDVVICASWTIAFRQELQRLSIKQDPTPEDLRIWKAAWDLLGRVEIACRKVLQPAGEAKALKQGTDSGTAQTSTAASTGRPFFERRPGWTVTDENCYRRCETKNAGREQADWEWSQAHEREKYFRERQAAAERELGAERERLSKAEARLGAAKRNLERREQFNRRAGEVAKGSPSDMLLGAARAAVRDAADEAAASRRRVELNEQSAAESRRSAEAAAALLARARNEAERARASYEDCLRNCYKQAAGSSGTSAGTGASSGTGTTTGATSGTGTSTGTAAGASTGNSGSHLPIGGGY